MKLCKDFWLAMALATSALVTACGGGGSTGTPNPVPSLTFLAPSDATAGGPAFTLTVNGANFVSGAVVQWNGSNRTTTFVSATQVTAAINASDIAQAGKAQLTVVNPAPGGGISNTFSFTINPAGNPVPVLNMLMPSTATVGGPAFMLTVTGSNFVSSSVVEWNGTGRTTTFGSATQLTALITAADIAAVGTARVQVFNPVPGGGSSNSVTFAINPAVSPTPSLASLMPASATAGGSDFTLNVAGGNFIPSSIVEWNGSGRATTFIDTSHLTAQITAADIATAGVATVTVLNPPPGGPSNALTFTINPSGNPVPVLNMLTPSTASAGGANFVLTVAGTNFISGATVDWNGSARNTTFVDTGHLTAQITAADIANSGTATVTVVNPPPGGGPSTNSLTFTITGNPAPSVTGLSPFSTPAGGAAFTLTVAGANFIPGSTVEWNASSRMTTFMDSNHLTAQITAADIAAVGTAQVTVFTPAPGGGSSSPFLFTISTPGQTLGVVQTVSANTNGFPGNKDSFAPFLSASGEFIAFDSAATNLSPDNLNANHDIFLRDSCLGAGAPAGCSPTTTRESSAPNGSLADAGSFGPSPISDDGRFVAFQSNAKDLVANDTTTTEEVFLRDTCTGQPSTCTPQTLQASLSNTGAQQTGGSSDHAAISATGRYVAFSSNANNLVTTTTNGLQQIYLRDTCQGPAAPSNCMTQTLLISADGSGNAANNNSDLPSASADGRFVVFQSAATNLVSNVTSGIQHIYVRDTCLGPSAPSGCTAKTTLVSADSSGNAGNMASQFPVLSRDGRFVVFSSVATNLVNNDINGKSDVFLRDTCEGSAAPSGCLPSTTLVSLASDNATQGTGDSFTNIGSAFSADDRFIIFGSNATNLLLPGGNPAGQVFVRDTCFGQPTSCTPNLVMVSVDSTGAPVGGNAWTLSGDGHFVVFSSLSGASGVKQIFLALTSF